MTRIATLMISGLIWITGLATAQIHNPVTWQSSVEALDNGNFKLTFDATIEPGWAVYSQFLESDEGPVATTINYDTPDKIELIGDAIESGHKKEGFDPIFEMNVIKFVDEFRIEQIVNWTGDGPITGYLNFMTCDDTKCLPPTDFVFSFQTGSTPATATKQEEDDGAAAAFGEVEGLATFSESDKSGIVLPVSWTAEYLDDRTVVFAAQIDDGWHIYGQEMDGDGPIPTEFWFNQEQVILPVEATELVEEKDEFFDGMLVRKVKHEATYTYRLPQGVELIEGELIYMACNKESCTAPQYVPIRIDTQLKTVTIGHEDAGAEAFPSMTDAMFPLPPVNLEEPVVECGDIATANVKKKGLWSIFLLGFVGGLLALLTPCVFPMIPLTVSFFTKGSEDRRKGINRAFLYGFFILLVYLLLSIPFHLLDSVNPGILNDISTNIWLNIFFFAIFVFFAFSFFGYYELTLPSKWTNSVSNAESVGGTIGVFFMALTLALVSFSCTGPILGSLLAGALTSEGGAMQLTSGMAGFGLALALPFALFAAFPSWLSSLPKSGGWLNTVKVVLGFLELAAAFKFLSNADLVKRWGLLKIEPFLAIWIVIFVLLALYLLGKLRFPHDSPVQKIGWMRRSFGLISIAFALYLGTGFMVDQEKGSFRSLTLLSGLAPPAGYSWIHPKKCPNNLDCFKDLSQGLAYAKKVNKPIMLDFTGHACVNCRKMEEHVWPKEPINDKLQNDFVLISLYVDEKIELPADQRTDRMRNYGQKWASFQAQYFNNNSQPYYVLLSPDGQLLNHPVGYTPDATEYAAFLECGLNAFQELNGQQETLGLNR